MFRAGEQRCGVGHLGFPRIERQADFLNQIQAVSQAVRRPNWESQAFASRCGGRLTAGVGGGFGLSKLYTNLNVLHRPEALKKGSYRMGRRGMLKFQTCFCPCRDYRDFYWVTQKQKIQINSTAKVAQEDSAR